MTTGSSAYDWPTTRRPPRSWSPPRTWPSSPVCGPRSRASRTSSSASPAGSCVTDPLRVAWVAARGQLVSFVRSPVTALLALALPLNLLLLLSLFALTGYHAPTGLVLGEDTPAGRSFVQALRDAHNSFELRPMTRADALDQLRHGRLVAMIEVPTGFAADVAAGRPARVPLTIDNVNLDLTEDVRRAVPAAAAIFADRQARSGIRVTADLRNTLPHDTGYVDYLGVSAVALAAVIAGGI